MTETPTRGHHEQFFDHSPDLMSVGDLDGRILHANAAFSRVLGWDPETITRGSFIDYVHPNDVKDTLRQLAGFSSGRSTVEFQNRCRTPDGSYRIVEWSVAINDDRVFAIGRDVTERVELTDRLGQSEGYMRSVLDTVMNGIITIDVHGTIQSVNRAALRMFGYQPGELVGHNVSMLMPEPDHSRHDGYLDHYVETGEAHIIGTGRQVTARRKDGTTFPLHLSVDEFRSGGDRYFTGALQDLTQQVEAIHQLEQARIAAESANLAKSQFLSRASHELRTPLNAIIGFAQLMDLDHEASDPEAVSTILSASQHLLGLITDMLDVSRIEAGEMPLQQERVRLHEVLRECAALLQPSGASRIELPDRNGYVVLADRQRLRQIVLNLLSNALKYGGDEPVVVHTDPTPDGLVAVSVRDSGPGIPAHLHGSAFAPFERLGKEATAVEGSGLGLTVAARLVSLMGGEIGVESEPGKGSRFWFSVPDADAGVD